MISAQVFSICAVDRVRQWHIVKLFGRFVALGISPVEEFERFGRAGGILRLLIHENEGRAGDRPRFRARLIGQNDVVTIGVRPVGAGRGGLESSCARCDSLAVLVDHLHRRHLVLQGVGVLDVPDGAFRLDHVVGDALVALRADACRPFDARVGADIVAPIGADLGQIVGEDERRPGTVRAMHDDDRVRRKLDIRVQLLDRRIVPLGDLAKENIGERRSIEDQIVRLDAIKIDDRHIAADDGRELNQAGSRQLLGLERHVRGAEGDRLVLDLLDAAA